MLNTTEAPAAYTLRSAGLQRDPEIPRLPARSHARKQILMEFLE